MRAPAAWRRSEKAKRADARDEGRIFSFTTVRSDDGDGGKTIAIIELPGKEKIISEIVLPSGGAAPRIGDRVVPVCRIITRGPPIEYGSKWALLLPGG